MVEPWTYISGRSDMVSGSRRAQDARLVRSALFHRNQLQKKAGPTWANYNHFINQKYGVELSYQPVKYNKFGEIMHDFPIPTLCMNSARPLRSDDEIFIQSNVKNCQLPTCTNMWQHLPTILLAEVLFLYTS